VGEPPDPALCGNGVLDSGEACDDANDIPDDGCEEDCSPSDVVAGCGDGAFDPARVCLATTAPFIADGAFFVVAGDFDGDGTPDLATANRATDSAGIFLNDAGRFTPSEVSSGAPSPFALVSADFTGDGLDDLAITHQIVSSVTLLESQGDGTFATLGNPITVEADPFAIIAADLTGDGAADLVVPCTGSGVFVLRNQGAGVFDKTRIDLPGSADAAAAGDFDQDGDTDFVVASAEDDALVLFSNDGAGVFTNLGTLPTGNGPESLAAGDIDGDGRLDLAVADSNGDTLRVFFGAGDFSFSGALVLPAVDDNPQSVALGDFNGDGALDLVVSHLFTTNLRVHLNNRARNFAAPQAVTVGESPFGLLVLDLNADSADDVAVVESGDSSLRVLFSNH
jgi:cysteine-rich repeat protein